MKQFFSSAKEAIKNLFRKPNTILFPIDQVFPPENLRGKPDLIVENCSLCQRCARICPTGAITIDKKSKLEGVLNIDIGLCCYCGECQEICNFDAIHLTNGWLTANLKREELITSYQIRRDET